MRKMEAKIVRDTGNYVPDFQRFLLHTKNYVRQYNQLYLIRLTLSRDCMINRVKARWGSSSKILGNIIDLEEAQNEGDECVMIGMLSKDHKLRGSVLDDFREGLGISGAVLPLTALTSDKDALILEDNSGRVTLGGHIRPEIPHLVSGIIIAVRGTLSEDGEFLVSDWLFSYDLEVVSSATISPTIPNAPAKYVLLLSGLLIGSAAPNDVHDLSVQLLVDFICGRFGDEHSTQLAGQIARVVVAGNSVIGADPNAIKEKFSTQKYKASLSVPSKQLDLWVAQLLSSCFVDILPGATDPANIAIPQQPFHPCLFPHSARFSSFERVTNPYRFQLDEATIMGHSGQPVNDIARLTFDPAPALRQKLEHQANAMDVIDGPAEGGKNPCVQSSSLTAGVADESQNTTNDSIEMDDAVPIVIDTTEDAEEVIIDVDIANKPKRIKADMKNSQRRLEILKNTLQWGHIAPTAPDTMPVYPFSEDDPLIITSSLLPDIYFAGNQPGFATELVTVSDGQGMLKQVRLVCIPNFRETGKVVLCNILDPARSCITMTFM